MIFGLNKTLKKFIISNINNPLIDYFIKYLIKKKHFVFCYHEVTDEPSEFQKKYELFVTKKNFKFQISILKNMFNKKKNKILDQNFLITFDDGYKEAFDYALNICKENSIKPIYFLNMHAIINKNPILSAQVLFLKENSINFRNFCSSNRIKEPEYLNIKPKEFNKFCLENKIDLDLIKSYQGKIVNLDDLKLIDKKNDLYLSSHLFKHYNSINLSDEEFNNLLIENKKYLQSFKNYLSTFAFTNGQPKSCFNIENVKILKSLNFKIIFSSFGSLYSDGFLFDRLVLTDNDDTENKIKQKILISYFKKFFYFKKLYL